MPAGGAIERAKVGMRAAFVPKLSAAVPASKGARHLQIENKVRAVIKHEPVSEIPLVP